MDLLIALVIFMIAMFACILTHVTMLLALLTGYVCFIAVALRRGNKLSALLRLSASGMKNSMVVVLTLFFIGILTASWRSSGTILFFVYYGIKIITPNLFLIITFLLTCLLSYAIGTSFGVAGTLGVICMALARSGGVDEIVTAGVIMSGIYFGDRCSPVSSSLILTAAVTNTDSSENSKRLLRTVWLPAGICIAAYTYLSFRNPLQNVSSILFNSIEKDFSISVWIIVPALFMLILPLFKVDVKVAMGLSILSAGIVSVSIQGMPVLAFIRSCIMGYCGNGGSLGAMLNGGGLVSMLEINGILLISCTYSSLFEGTGMIRDLQGKLERYTVKVGRFPVTALCGIILCAVFCNQTIAVTMSAAVLSQPYKNRGGTSQELAIDIGNSTIVIAGLVPWAIASSVPLKFMGVGAEALPFAFLLYAIPVCYLFTKKTSLICKGLFL